jgi:hypothetical protein
MEKAIYVFWVFLTLPFAGLGIVTGLLELAIGTSCNLTNFLVKPFLWAYDRKRGVK